MTQYPIGQYFPLRKCDRSSDPPSRMGSKFFLRHIGPRSNDYPDQTKVRPEKKFFWHALQYPCISSSLNTISYVSSERRSIAIFLLEKQKTKMKNKNKTKVWMEMQNKHQIICFSFVCLLTFFVYKRSFVYIFFVLGLQFQFFSLFIFN